MNNREKYLKEALRVYFILGSANCNDRKPIDVLSQAISGGITMFQFREKGLGGLSGQDKYDLAAELQFICRNSNIPFIVNDDVDLALAIGADGVHIGQEDESAQLVREKMKDKILGISVHNLSEADKALRAGADYFGVGPIFPTNTKKDTREVQGVQIISKLRQNGYTNPIVGIGGITHENAAEVIESGADGVSVISAISLADDIQSATSNMKQNVTIALK